MLSAEGAGDDIREAKKGRGPCGRAALAGKLLKDMGYAQVYNLGGLKDWAEAGGPVSEPVDQGM